MRAQVDGHFGRCHPKPEQDGLERKRRNDFAAIAEKQRDMNSVRDLVREIDKAGGGDEADFFIWLAPNARKLHEIATLSRHLGEALNLWARVIRIRRCGQFRR